MKVAGPPIPPELDGRWRYSSLLISFHGIEVMRFVDDAIFLFGEQVPHVMTDFHAWMNYCGKKRKPE